MVTSCDTTGINSWMISSSEGSSMIEGCRGHYLAAGTGMWLMLCSKSLLIHWWMVGKCFSAAQSSSRRCVRL